MIKMADLDYYTAVEQAARKAFLEAAHATGDTFRRLSWFSRSHIQRTKQ